MTFEPALVTEKVRLPDGASGADTVQASSLACTVRARPDGALWLPLPWVCTLSVQAASNGSASRTPDNAPAAL